MTADEVSDSPIRCDVCKGTKPDTGELATLRVRFLDCVWSVCPECIPALETSHDFKLLSRIPDIPCDSCDESALYIIKEEDEEISVCRECLRERRKRGADNVNIIDHPLNGTEEESSLS